MTSCLFRFGSDYDRGVSAESSGDYAAAIRYYKHVVLREPHSAKAILAAKSASRISLYDLKDYQSALIFLRFLTSHAGSAERITAQQQVAGIYYNDLADYQQAVLQYNRLLNLPLSRKDRYRDRFRLAKSYYFLNRFDQAKAELQQLPVASETTGLPHEFVFKALVLKANIFLGLKQVDKAIGIFRQVMGQFPNLSQKDDIALNLAVCYEEENKFEKSIEVLRSIRNSYPSPQFIDSRIKRLQDRIAQMPRLERRKQLQQTEKKRLNR